MSTPATTESQNSFPTFPAVLTDLISRHPGYDFVPLLELVTCQSPDGYEAFFNHVAELVCRHLHDGEWDNRYLVRFLHELFRFRDAFRGMRGAAAWE